MGSQITVVLHVGYTSVSVSARLARGAMKDWFPLTAWGSTIEWL